MESPFNKISQLELLHEAVKVKNDHADVQETTLRYLRYTFASVWFGKNDCFIGTNEISSEKYYAENKDALRLPDTLLLTEKDNKLNHDTVIFLFIKDICHQLENSTTVSDFCRNVQTIKCTLMLPPNSSICSLAEYVERKIKRFALYAESNGETRKAMLLKCLDLYENIAPWLSDKKIAEIIARKSFVEVFNKSIEYDDDVYIQTLQFINSIVKMCEQRSELSDVIIKDFSSIYKTHFPSNLIEKLFAHLMDIILKDKSWIELTKVPSTRVILTLMANVIRQMPIVLDETYVNLIFQKLMNASKIFLKSKKEKSTYLNSHIINQIFGIIEILTSLKYSFKLADDDYNTIFLWLMENERSNRALLWAIIANLTSQKDTFNAFCKNFKYSLEFSLNDFIFKSIEGLDAAGSLNIPKLHDQKALALVLANFIEHSTDACNRELFINDSLNEITLAKRFLYRKQICPEALRLIVKKMIQNNTADVDKIVRRRNIIEKLLNNDIESLDAVITCYRHEKLKEHVTEIVTHMQDVKLMNFISSMKHSADLMSHDPKHIVTTKILNRNVLNLILILIATPSGLDKFKKVLRYSTVLEKFILVMYDGLKTTNNYSEINFHILFLNSLLGAFKEANIIAMSVFGEIEFRLSNQDYFLRIVRDVVSERHQKAYTIYETNIRQAHHPVDLMLLQAVNIFNHCDTSTIPAESELIMIVKKLTYFNRNINFN